ncbi:protein WVD2-like 5 isoform X2 [Carica papaya]|uniref:protein WVD2-like 5 isoform X2 n=1 Tax=Carica papaya TaxID=3649 RepID=UPI000B8C7158|nr:protein WVD2-like 5 isoform X2 [Carica papaya]
MMDSGNVIPADGLDASHENGVHKELAAGENVVVSGAMNGSVDKTAEIGGTNGISESESKLEDGGPSEELKEESDLLAESSGLANSEEGQVNDGENSRHAKQPKGQSKIKNEKNPGARNVSSVLIKKTKDAQNAEATTTLSNGAVGLNSRSGQSFKSRSFNDRQVNATKQPLKSDAASSEGLTEITKLKPLKKESLNKVEEDAQSSPSPKEADAKARRVGALPNYGFSFKCDERAEKRKEFYSKLEEKIHAREVEKSNMQAKSKETQEAEIKMFRKSLNFKATPMPSFYQEPAPPKVELKKIPPTRAKSPKLGRKKTLPPPESEGNSSERHPPDRLSLDEKVSDINLGKGTSPIYLKKPQRKSLPVLPSEQTGLSNAKNGEKSALRKPTTKTTNDRKLMPSKTTEKGNTVSVDASKDAVNPIQVQAEAGDTEHHQSEAGDTEHHQSEASDTEHHQAEAGATEPHHSNETLIIQEQQGLTHWCKNP